MNVPRCLRFLVLGTILALLAPLQTAPAGAAGADMPDTTVTAVLVRPWATCPPSATDTLWDELNSRWSDYGTTPIVIDLNHPQLCPGPVTYADLVSSGADVVILSDPAGGKQQFTTDEIAALQQYAQDGHRLIATYLLLQYTGYDNRGLAPLFGLPAGASYVNVGLPSRAYTLLSPGHPLFAGMAAPYNSGGLTASQAPADGSWAADDLAGAEILAQTADSGGVILAYNTPAYDAVYITSMPEYKGNTEDERFLYNALTSPRSRHFLFLPLVLRDG